MENFRKSQKPGKQSASLDGFVQGKGRGQSRAPSLNDFNQYYRPEGSTSRMAQPKLDDFKGPEGFRPAQNPALPLPNQANKPQEITSEPLEQKKPEVEHKHKKKLFRRKSKRHAHSKEVVKQHKWRKVALKSGAVFMVAVLLVGGFLFAKGYFKARGLFKGGGGAAALTKDVDPTQLKGEGDGRVNILMLGKGGEEHTAPDLTDTLLLVSINPIDKEAAMLSVPRDLYVKAPSGGSSKINSVYANAKYAAQTTYRRQSNVEELSEKAGMEAIEKVVEETMGVPIHYYVMVDFEAFRKAIDTVGGIDVYTDEALYDSTVAWENGGSSRLAAQGWNHFNGKQALLYSRSRQSSARGDFDRTERQRKVLLALKDKVISAGTFANPIRITQLIDAFGDHMQTNLSLDEVKRVYEIGKEIDASKVASLGLADPPNSFVKTDAVNNQSVVVPRAGLYNYSEIHNYVRNAMRDGFLKSENASVVVLNGTEITGLATRKAEELRSYGYNVTKVDSAPTSTYTGTVLVDLTNGTKKYTKRYLEQRLKTTAVSKVPDSTVSTVGADFIIILGSDQQ
jgi:LCP family protein required for cell wall assembly